jgi:hypothetical protein
MTPKEKAKELIHKYSNIVIESTIGDMYDTEYIESNMDIESTKQCALICVDEILNFDIKAKNESQFIIEQRIEDYWGEVKKEIEKL